MWLIKAKERKITLNIVLFWPPWWLSCKESAWSAGVLGDTGSIPGSKRSSGGGHGKPLQVFLSGESHGQQRLMSYSPDSCKESDMTEATYTILVLWADVWVSFNWVLSCRKSRSERYTFWWTSEHIHVRINYDLSVLLNEKYYLWSTG